MLVLSSFETCLALGDFFPSDPLFHFQAPPCGAFRLKEIPVVGNSISKENGSSLILPQILIRRLENSERISCVNMVQIGTKCFLENKM